MQVLASQCQRFQSRAIGHSGGFSKVGAYRAAEMEIRSQSGGSARGLHVADRPPLSSSSRARLQPWLQRRRSSLLTFPVLPPAPVLVWFGLVRVVQRQSSCVVLVLPVV